MRLGLHVLARVATRALVIFLALEAFLVAYCLLDVSRREPIVAGWALLGLIPIAYSYLAVPCALVALAAGTASSFACFRKDDEIVAISAAGIGPLPWVMPVVLLGVLATPWGLYSTGEVIPASRNARSLEREMLRRNSDTLLRILAADPLYLPGAFVHLTPTGRSAFRGLWFADLGSDRVPVSIIHAEAGTMSSSPDIDLVRLELRDVERWTRSASGRMEGVAAKEVVLERSLHARWDPSGGRKTTPAKRLSLSRLLSTVRSGPPEHDLRLVRAEIASRLILGLAPLPLLLASVVIGLRGARWGTAGGALLGIILVGGYFLPASKVCVRLIEQGHSAWIGVAPGVVLLAVSLPLLRRWT